MPTDPQRPESQQQDSRCIACGVAVADADATRVLGKVVCPMHAQAAVTLATDANRVLELWGLSDALVRGRDLWEGVQQIGRALDPGPPVGPASPPAPPVK